MECPSCHHKTSKPICSKCGSQVVAKDTQPVPDSNNAADSAQELLDTVRSWMTASDTSDGDVSLDDFTACVKTEHLTSSARDHLGAVIQVISGDVGKLFIETSAKLQPIKVAGEAKAIVSPWSGLVEQL